MPDPPTTAAAPRRTRKTVRIALFLLAVGVFPASLLLYARARGRADWPATMPPPVHGPDAHVPTSPEAWTLLSQLIERTPQGENRASALLAREDLSPNDPAIDAVLEAHSDSLLLFDRLLRMPPAALPHALRIDAQAPRYFSVLRTLDAALLRARRGPPSEIAEALARYERFASRFAFGGDSLLTAMIGVVLESHVIREIERLQRRDTTLSSNELEPLAAALHEASALPSPLAQSYAGECASLETLLQSIDQTGSWSRARGGDGDRPAPREDSLGFIARLSFDRDRTIAAHRARCQARIDALAAPRERYPRAVPEVPRVLHPEAPHLWEMLDNRAGRVLLNITEADVSRFAAREESVIAARELAQIAVALQRYAYDRNELPPSLAALATAYLEAPPGERIVGRALQWDPSQRRLSLADAPSQAPSAAPPSARANDHPVPTVWQINLRPRRTVEPTPSAAPST